MRHSSSRWLSSASGRPREQGRRTGDTMGSLILVEEDDPDGATDFVTKPFDNEYLNLVIGKTLERSTLRREVTALRSELESRFDTLVAASPKMNAVIVSAKKVAQSDSTVLLLGESGTGKDLLARSEEHTSELQSPCNLVCRLLLEKKKK